MSIVAIFTLLHLFIALFCIITTNLGGFYAYTAVLYIFELPKFLEKVFYSFFRKYIHYGYCKLAKCLN